MSKQIESQIEPGSRSDLPFFDRQPTTSIVSFRVEQSETGCPTVGSEIEIPGFHLFAVSTASPASIEVREPITPQSVGQRAGEYPVIATTKKTLCLGKTFPLMTVGTDNPVLGPQVLSEVQAIKKMRAMGIPMEDVDDWLDGKHIPTQEPVKSTYERLFPKEAAKSDKTGREAHLERLQQAISYNIEMMSAPPCRSESDGRR